MTHHPEEVRRHVQRILDVDAIPVAIRNQCHQLLLALELYEDTVRQRLERIQELAGEAGITIPDYGDNSVV
jgi:hypothetical protein